MVTLKQVYAQFTQSLATGLNRAADRFAEDITAQVPVRTGKLRAGYRVNGRASLTNLVIKIGPSERYGAKFYPWTNNFGRRQAQRPARARLFGTPDSVHRGRRVAIVKEEIIRAMAETGGKPGRIQRGIAGTVAKAATPRVMR
jgi:hypothetical protein